MKKITVPERTFEMYSEGRRTFIHLRKDDSQLEEIKKIQFGEEIILVAKESKKELKQTFWFLYDFKEIKRFVFLTFNFNLDVGQGRDPLFFCRRREANKNFENYNDKYFLEPTYDISSELEKRNYNILASLSGLFFISARNYPLEEKLYKNSLIRFYDGCEEKMTPYIILDVLTLKQFEDDYEGRQENEGIIWVASLIPQNFLWI